MNSASIEINDELFAQLTRFANQSDNGVDDRRRAECLGLGGRDILVAPGAIIRVRHPENIGNNTFIGLYTYINGDVTIGKNVLIGPHCSITAGHHKFDPETGWFSGRTEKDGDDRVVIGDGCWLASSVTITAGVHLGKCNLVCAGAVVTKDTPDYAIMAGVPARIRGYIDPKTGEYNWLREEEKK